jgi:adenylosuccinate synthase
MKKAKAVIGSAWGDCGKGLMVDYLSSQERNPLVLRYCGGANAGHTVQLADGRRHVFGHFGSGTLAGGTTFLSRFFLVNPLLWQREQEELKTGFDIVPKVAIDPGARMTIPHDMLINQFLETARSGARHGSVGVGIHETMVRSEHERWKITAALLDYPQVLRGRLIDISREYVPFRIDQLGIELSAGQTRLLYSEEVIDQYMRSVAWINMNGDFTLQAWPDAAAGRNIIFEGSQGLLLDEKNEQFFPFVTHARTGLPNILQLMDEAGIGEVDVTYMTRAYSTRHGDGPFPPAVPELKFEDPTNVRNEWQGTMRFGWMDMDLLESAIMHDLLDSDINKVRWSIGVTCLDQVEHLKPTFRLGGGLVHADAWSEIVDILAERLAAIQSYKSYGPTRDHIIRSNEKRSVQ